MYPTHLGGNQAGEIEASEKEAEAYVELSDAALVGLIGRATSNIVREASSAELQRRLGVEIRGFSDTSGRQSATLLRLTWVIPVSGWYPSRLNWFLNPR